MRVLATVAVFGLMLSATPAKARGKKVTLTGEVLDLVCYFKDPAKGQGPDHAKCAQKCIHGGLPAGLKVGKKVYLLLGSGHDVVSKKVGKFGGKQATITGKLIKEGGLPAVLVETAKAAKAKKRGKK